MSNECVWLWSEKGEKIGGICFLFGPQKFRVRLDGGVEKWEDGKYLIFPLVCLVGGVEKWEGGKLFCLVGEKWKDEKCNLYYFNIL